MNRRIKLQASLLAAAIADKRSGVRGPGRGGRGGRRRGSLGARLGCGARKGPPLGLNQCAAG